MQLREVFMRVAAMGLLCSLVMWGADKKVPLRSAENGSVEITATAFADREAVKQVLGSDLGGHYIVVEVRLTPKDAAKVAIHLDDFMLRTDKDGERTTPFAPSQIAGKGALVVSTGATSGGTVMSGGGGPPGMGPYGGLGGGMIGGGGSDGATEARATMRSGSKDKADPMLEVLKEKILPEKETEVPVSGLLYFPMEKQKMKDLELIYTTPEGKLFLRFGK
jgi:hypothetical protein